MLTKTTRICSICGDEAKEKLGCVACLAFFRRSISRRKVYWCVRGDGRCEVLIESRSECKSCRLKKCLKKGLRPENVRARDPIGPRLKSNLKSCSIEHLLLLQHRHHQFPRSSTINHQLSTSFRHSAEFSMQFESFRSLSKPYQNLILSEYAIAYFLIDKAFRSCSDPLITPLSAQLHHLQIDKTELVFLKILLLITPSFPGNIKITMSSSKPYISQLFNYCETPERFGEIILLIGLIRSLIKEFYNQTRQAGWLRNLEPGIQKKLLK